MFSVGVLLLAESEEQQRDKSEQRVERRMLRDASNPLDLPQTL